MGKIISILTLIGMCFAVFFYVDTQYAKCSDVKSIERRLDLKIESDKLAGTQARLWTLEDRFGSDPDKIQDKAVKQQMKELKVEVNILQDRVKGLVK